MDKWIIKNIQSTLKGYEHNKYKIFYFHTSSHATYSYKRSTAVKPQSELTTPGAFY